MRVSAADSPTMPGLITVSEFVREARDDQSSPTTSTFLHRIPHCRDTVNRLDEVRGREI
jgi:Arf-GAP/SH3 domain/ANK repeat/PH domain-containing protein